MTESNETMTCGCGHCHTEAHTHEHHEHGHEHHEHHEHHDHAAHADSCDCGHDHAHSHGGACSCEEGTETLDRTILTRVLVTAALLAVNLIFSFPTPVGIGLYVAALLLVGYDVLISAGRGLVRSFSLDETLLMSIACLGAFAIGEYFEGVLVMLLYQVGELFQGYAVGNSRKSIRSLVDLRPESVTLVRDGRETTVPAEEAAPGDVMLIRPGERVALDGRVVSGSSTLDTSALTGESLARTAEPGDDILSGCVNGSGVLTAEVTAPLEASAVSRILNMVEEAAEKKARPERFITRFARIYTPAVFVAALLIATIPSLVLGLDAYTWIYRSLTFLVISCPCALVISVPLTYFAGIGGASKKGVLFKGANSLDALRRTSAVVFDKTGTLTSGQFHVARIVPAGIGQRELLMLAAHAEAMSDHPLAQSIAAAWDGPVDTGRLSAYTETRGKGVSALLDGKPLLAGRQRYLEENGVTCPGTDGGATTVCVALDGRYMGHIELRDTVKAGAAGLLSRLRAGGIDRLVMLTGDNAAAAEKTAGELGIDELYADCLPEDKAGHLTDIMAGETAGTTVYMGDGINDAPVLAMADIGVAMGGLGSDAAIEAADVVIMSDEPERLCDAIASAKKTGRVVIQNITFALAVKALIMVFGIVGMVPLGLAVFADVGVSLLAVLNAMRAYR